MKQFRDTEAWKWIRLLLELLLIAAVIWVAVTLYTSLGLGEAKAEDEYETRYVICMPGDYVNIRPFPSTKHDSCGYLEPGDEVVTDGRKKNGFVHCVDMNTEASEGWVFAGYLITDKPERVSGTATIVSYGRLAARKYVNGKRTRWLKSGATVKVYYWSDSWVLTDCGYLMTKYLELDGE